MIAPQLYPSALAGDPRHQLFRVGKFIIPERYRQALRSGVHTLDIGTATQLLEFDDRKQVAHRIRHRSKSFNQFGNKAVRLGRHIQIGNPAIQRQPYCQIAYILFGNAHLQPQIDLRCPVDRLFDGFTLASARHLDSLPQHFLIKFNSDLAHMSRLFISQQVSGTANIHIVGGQREPGTKRVQRLHYLQPAARLRSQQPVGIRRQIGIGTKTAPPDPAAQLIKLRQAKHVRAMNDHGICRGNIDPRFHNIGRQQDICLTISELCHHGIQLGRRHAPVGRQDAGFGHQRYQPVIDTLQIVNPRADTKHLAAAEHLALDGFTQHNPVPWPDKGAHGKPVHRRC